MVNTVKGKPALYIENDMKYKNTLCDRMRILRALTWMVNIVTIGLLRDDIWESLMSGIQLLLMSHFLTVPRLWYRLRLLRSFICMSGITKEKHRWNFMWVSISHAKKWWMEGWRNTQLKTLHCHETRTLVGRWAKCIEKQHVRKEYVELLCYYFVGTNNKIKKIKSLCLTN
jgi:hypothetical protein